MMSDMTSSESEIIERRKTEALSYFQFSYNKKATEHYTEVFISLLDSIPFAVNKFLHATFVVVCVVIVEQIMVI